VAAVASTMTATACAGVSKDVSNVPVPTNPAEPSESSVTSPAVGGAVGSTAGEALWTTLEVIDGDTIRVDGPDGQQTVRMIGINAPERGECFYDDATAALQYSLGDRGVRLVRDVSDVDRNGRALRYVEFEDGSDVGAALVEGGYVRSHHYEPDIGRSDEYDELQEVAEQAGVGLWAVDACGVPSAPRAPIAVDGQYNAPGDDNDNLNDEWVTFTNTGTDPIDLSGWQVADESSSHRYSFGALTLAAGAAVTLYTGCGSDTDTERYWCNEDGAVWNNTGDTVFLRDGSGNNVVAETYRG